MDLSRLKWFKFINHPDKQIWSYSREHLKEIHELSKQGLGQPVIDENGVTIFALGFQNNSRSPLAGDLIMLAQRSKVTHIVEVLDDDFFKKGDWHHRYVRAIWWKPDLKNWQELKDRDGIVGHQFTAQGQSTFELPASFGTLNDYWAGQGGLKAFQAHVAQALQSC